MKCAEKKRNGKSTKEFLLHVVKSDPESLVLYNRLKNKISNKFRDKFTWYIFDDDFLQDIPEEIRVEFNKSSEIIANLNKLKDRHSSVVRGLKENLIT